MPRTIGQRELGDGAAEVIRGVAGGESFIVTRNGAPVAELRPLEGHKPRFVTLAALLRAAGSGPHFDARQYRADLDRIDRRL